MFVAGMITKLPHFIAANFQSANFKGLLSVDGTLTSILTTPMAGEEPCHKFKNHYTEIGTKHTDLKCCASFANHA